MAHVQELVRECRANSPNVNLFYKQGPLQTRGLPLLYLAASRSNRDLWKWLLAQLLEQVPEAEKPLVSAVAHLQWHATNREREAIATLLAEHGNVVLAKCPLWDPGLIVRFSDHIGATKGPPSSAARALASLGQSSMI